MGAKPKLPEGAIKKPPFNERGLLHVIAEKIKLLLQVVLKQVTYSLCSS